MDFEEQVDQWANELGEQLARRSTSEEEYEQALEQVADLFRTIADASREMRIAEEDD